MAIVDRPTDQYLDAEAEDRHTPVIFEADLRDQLGRPEVVERLARVKAIREQRRQAPDERRDA